MQHQLFACLVLKNFLRTDYRGITAHLADCPSLLKLLQLKRVPHFTTLQKAAQRLLVSAKALRLLNEQTRLHLGRRQRVDFAAIDSIGLECTTASGYFIKRRVRVSEHWKKLVYHYYAKLGIVCETACHFVLAFRVGRGPRPDVDEFRPLVAEAQQRVNLSLSVGDAAYDSEANHNFARDQHGIRTVIPAKQGRPPRDLPAGVTVV